MERYWDVYRHLLGCFSCTGRFKAQQRCEELTTGATSLSHRDSKGLIQPIPDSRKRQTHREGNVRTHAQS